MWTQFVCGKDKTARLDHLSSDLFVFSCQEEMRYTPKPYMYICETSVFLLLGVAHLSSLPVMVLSKYHTACRLRIVRKYMSLHRKTLQNVKCVLNLDNHIGNDEPQRHHHHHLLLSDVSLKARSFWPHHTHSFTNVGNLCVKASSTESSQLWGVLIWARSCVPRESDHHRLHMMGELRYPRRMPVRNWET